MADEISNTAPQWWEIQNVPTEMIRELRRRSNSNNLGMSISTPFTNATFNFEKSYNDYKGPLSPWVKVFSNGTGKAMNSMVPSSVYLEKGGVKVDYDGFILKGGDGFYDAFGYENGKSLANKNAIIGYEANGKPHYIDGAYRNATNYSSILTSQFPQNNQTPSLLPPPGVISVEVKQSKELLTFASFKFKCFGLAQLEYMTPFFLTQGINIFIEFGWNLYNQKSTLNLVDPNECWKIIEEPQTALDRSIKSNGNYGCVTGIVTNYNFTTTDGFLYECSVETISRQGLFAGMRVDNNASVDNKVDDTEKTFLDFKTFVKVYLPSINDVIKQPKSSPYSNFLNYIVNNSKNIQKNYFDENKEKEETKANEEQANKTSGGKPVAKKSAAVTSILNAITSSMFYEGKSEDRIFTGRRADVYRAGSLPNQKIEEVQKDQIQNRLVDVTIIKALDIITYGKMGTNNQYTQISFADVNDFDADSTNDEVWLQLDFVFEFCNLLMSSQKQYKIENKDVIINAHPNLISCDRDILIPNPISPKINKGFINNVAEKTKKSYGYLNKENMDGSKNKFVIQKADYGGIDKSDNLELAKRKVKKVFKTDGWPRDNLDVIINYLYYHSQNKNKKDAAFPFKNDNGKYKKYYYGYLKNILISKSKLLSIAADEGIKTYKQFLNAVLNVVNNATDNFWKFSVDNGNNGFLSIVDKNTINFETLSEVYMFDVGGTGNVIKSINFDVKLTNEQSVNVLFGGQNSNTKATDYINKVNVATSKTELQATFNQLSNEPFLKFMDRMDIYQIKKFIEAKGKTLNDTAQPGTPKNLEDNNNEIAYLQTYGKKPEVLCMTVKNITSGDAADAENLNTKYLNLPPNMKGKLRAILDDMDFKNNIAKYSGVADNFQVDIVFDGIYGFRNLQVFALSNLPKPYVPGNVIFQILEVHHEISNGKWETKVSALVRSVGGSNLKYIRV